MVYDILSKINVDTYSKDRDTHMEPFLSKKEMAFDNDGDLIMDICSTRSLQPSRLEYDDDDDLILDVFSVKNLESLALGHVSSVIEVNEDDSFNMDIFAIEDLEQEIKIFASTDPFDAKDKMDKFVNEYPSENWYVKKDPVWYSLVKQVVDLANDLSNLNTQYQKERPDKIIPHYFNEREPGEKKRNQDVSTDSLLLMVESAKTYVEIAALCLEALRKNSNS